MMTRLGFVLAVAVAALSACSGGAKTTPLPPDEAKALLIERNWVDRLPQKVDDQLHVFRFVPKMGGGVYQDRTIFAGTFELFMFDADGKTIRFNLLHTGDKKSCAYRIEELATPGPEGVDLKLTIDGSPRGPSVYYSWKKGGADLDAELAHLYDKK
jgi:hypothetical protein